MDAVQTWRYSFPNEKYQGWAIIFLDSEGCFAALSDYGDHSYRWNPRGFVDGQDFRLFIIQCDDSYLTGKLGQGKREYDPEGTLANVRDAIIQARKEEGEKPLKDQKFTRERAREEWDSLVTYDNLRTEFEFYQWLQYTDLGGDSHELGCQRYPHDLQAFVKLVMPKLRETLKRELKLNDNSVAT